MAGIEFIVVENPAELGEHAVAWQELAGDALEANPFHEPWMLRPAIEAFGGDAQLRVVLAYARTTHLSLPSRSRSALCGVFPLELRTHYRGLPLRHLAFWRHLHCFLGTPLLRRSSARDCLEAFFDWLGRDPLGASALEWELLGADGAFIRLLQNALRAKACASFVRETSSRATLRRLDSAHAYLKASVTGKGRHELRRLERRLAERGELRYAELGSGEDAEHWIEAFLSLEAAGWKGRAGTALASSVAGQQFFKRAALAAARQGRLMMLGLHLGAQPIALKCNFLAGEAGFTFKIAYDERFAAYSPGTLLELENIRRFHARPELAWMDSCAEQDHFTMNRLWLDRRPIVTMVTGARRVSSDLFVHSLPLLHWTRRMLRGMAPAMARE
jgi:CelD/BcsL family acetyltransferase involved in cellulose biosynthesis